MSYKWCLVPGCSGNSKDIPEKLFIYVPTEPTMRKMWLEAARRDPNEISVNSSVYMCEDHFDMENDMANFMQFKMGYSKKILMKKGVLPTKFHCQQDSCKRPIEIDSSDTRTVLVKRKKLQQIVQLEQHSARCNNEAEVREGVEVSQEPIAFRHNCGKEDGTSSPHLNYSHADSPSVTLDENDMERISSSGLIDTQESKDSIDIKIEPLDEIAIEVKSEWHECMERVLKSSPPPNFSQDSPALMEGEVSASAPEEESDTKPEIGSMQKSSINILEQINQTLHFVAANTEKLSKAVQNLAESQEMLAKSQEKLFKMFSK